MAGFQIDMSPLNRSAVNVGRALVDIGQNVGSAIQQSRQRSIQEQEQGDVEAFMRQAMSGDPVAFEELMVKSPQAANQVAQYLQQQQATQQAGEEAYAGERLKANQATVEKLYRIQTMPEQKRQAAIQELVNDPFDDFDETDIPFLSDPRNLQSAAVKYFGADDAKARFGGLDTGLSDQPSSVQETEWFLKQSDKIQDTHLKIKRGEKPSLDEKLAYEKSKAEIKEDSAITTARKKTQEERRQGYIDSGVSSADNLMTVNRSIDLLDSIKTGGIDNAILRAKQAFGIESADEAELTYELGKSVLKQLKPTFGAAFTINEMLELKRMEAGLGKSVAGNKRILKNLSKMIERSAKRGMRAAESLGDDFAANEIMIALSGDERKPPTESAGDEVAPTGAGSQNDQALFWAKSNPNDPRSAAILQKLGAR